MQKKLNIFTAIFTVFGVLFSLPALAMFSSYDYLPKTQHEFEKGEMIIKYKGEKDFRVLKLSGNEDVLDAVGKYKKNKDVEYAEPNYIVHAFSAPNDPYYSFQWNLNNLLNGGIHTEQAWDTAIGAGVTVAVVDTGIAYENYSDRKGKYYKAPDFNQTCFKQGYDFVNKDVHANDDNSHGTHVAGTIAQSTNNAQGVAGVAYGACLIPIKVLDKNGSGTSANVASGIRFAADKGAQVINLSLGSSASSQAIQDAVNYAYQKGVTVVAASGNDGASQVSYPAAYDDYVIAVGATRYDRTLASYSNYGQSIDIVAPGGDLSKDQNGDGYADGILQNTFNPTTKKTNSFGYWFFQGTSMASPHVAGAAALVISHGNATAPDSVRTVLQSSADDLGDAGWDSMYGFGFVNAQAALAWIIN